MGSFTLGFASAAPLMLILGPVAVLLLDTGMERGFRWGWPAAAGVVVADATFATVASVARAGLATWLDSVSSLTPIVSSITLAAVGVWLLATSRRPGRDDMGPSEGTVQVDSGDRLRLARNFWALTSVNPLTVVAFGALVVAAGPAASGPGWPVGVALASLTVHFALVATGASVRSLVGPSAMLHLRVGGGLGVLALAFLAL